VGSGAGARTGREPARFFPMKTAGFSCNSRQVPYNLRNIPHIDEDATVELNQISQSER
jgi:hypothetical protein